MPASRYRPFWQRMPAFALPSFYDGRVRVNLAGREAQGRVPLAGYAAACGEVEALLRACRDPATGEGVVDFIERPATRDPLALGATESDLVVVWKGMPCALDHPILGRVGPLPYRRPGGHTGPHGLAYFHNAGVGPGDYGVRSTFDVVPALIELLGEPRPAGLSGAGLFAAGAAAWSLSAEVR